MKRIELISKMTANFGYFTYVIGRLCTLFVVYLMMLYQFLGIFLITTASRPTLGPIRPPIQ